MPGRSSTLRGCDHVCMGLVSGAAPRVLESSLCWGAMAVATFMFFQPFIEGIVDIYYDRFGKLVAMVILVGYCIDFSTSFYRAWGERAENKQETIPQNEMEEPEPELSR